MADILNLIQNLVKHGKVLISDHGYDELAADDVFVEEILEGVKTAIIIESYPDYYKGPCVLVLQRDFSGKPVHAVWGIPKGATTPAVLVTAYRPMPERWSTDFMRRLK